MTDPLDPQFEDDFATLRQAAQPLEKTQPTQGGGSLTQRLGELDPRMVVAFGIGAIVLVTIAGLAALFFLARNSPSASPPTVVVVAGEQSPAPALPTTTPLASFTATSLPTAAPSPTIDLTATITNLPAMQFATLSEMKGTVQIRIDENSEWTNVNSVVTIVPGTIVLTGEGSAVRITFSNSSVVRLGPQTQFVLKEMSGTPSRPRVILQLDFGKLWAIVGQLGEGVFEVQMPIGVAAVRGSFMSAEHNATDQIEIVTCLEGECSYRNDNGQQALDDMEQTESVKGGPPSPAHPMDENQLDDWSVNNVPEVFTLTPTATATLTATASRTPTETRTPTVTRTPTNSRTPSASPTPSLSPTPSRTSTATNTSTRTNTSPPPTNTPVTPPTNTPTATLIPTNTDTPTATLVPTDTETPTATLVPTDTETPTATNTSVPTLDHFEVVCPGTATTGTPVGCTVTAKDNTNTTITTYTGTVTLSSSDGSATFAPTSPYTFQGSDNGAVNISVTFMTVGTQSFAAQDGGASGSTNVDVS